MEERDKIDLIAAMLAAAEIGAGKISATGAVARFRMLRDQLQEEGLAGPAKEPMAPASKHPPDQPAGQGDKDDPFLNPRKAGP